MLSAALVRVVTPPTKTLNTIWVAFLVSPFAYGAVAWFVAAGDGSPGDAVAVLRPVLGGLAAVLVAASYLIRRWALAPPVIAARLSAPSPAPPPGAPGLAPEEARLARLVPHYQTMLIVVMGLRETAAVLGLVLAIVARSFWAYLPFGVLAAAAIASQPPAVGPFLENAARLLRRDA